MTKTIGLDQAISSIWAEIESISNTRFTSYRQQRDKSELDALARHAWNISLCQHMQPSLHASELLLRNEIHRCMTATYSVNWLSDSSIIQSNEFDKVLGAESDIMRDGQTVTSDRVVSRLGFGFWVNLFNHPYEYSIVRPVLAKGFKGFAPGPTRNRAYIRGVYDEVLKIRNRAFHLEPIWNSPNLLQKIETIWQTVAWISPIYSVNARLFCQFEDTFNSGQKYCRAELLASIQMMVDKHNAKQATIP